MEMRKLGKELSVSAVGFGCMGFSHAYGAPLEDKKTIEGIRKAYELGYTFFDTAEVYGTADDPHVNEKLVGEALKPVRNHVQIASKFGIRFDMETPSGTSMPCGNHKETPSGDTSMPCGNYKESKGVNHPLITDARPEVIRTSVEGSLKRLQTDHIDLYIQHRIDSAVEPETVAGVMADLIKEGKILHWGISEANEEYLRRAHAVCPVSAVENRYSMMARHYETLFPVLEELGVGFVAFSPMANGFLTGAYGKGTLFDKKLDYRSNMPQFTDEAVEQNQRLLELLHAIAEDKNATPAQISMAWMLCKKPWIVPIPGTRKEERMRENVGAADVKLSGADVRTLDDELDKMEMSEVFGGSRIVGAERQRA